MKYRLLTAGTDFEFEADSFQEEDLDFIIDIITQGFERLLEEGPNEINFGVIGELIEVGDEWHELKINGETPNLRVKSRLLFSTPHFLKKIGKPEWADALTEKIASIEEGTPKELWKLANNPKGVFVALAIDDSFKVK